MGRPQSDEFSPVSTLFNPLFALHYNSGSRDSCVARLRFGRLGYSEYLIEELGARYHGNLHGRGPEANEVLLHSICAKDPLNPPDRVSVLPKGLP